MTGLGARVLETAAGRFEAEARSVNHRFLKVSIRLPPALEALEPVVEERVRARVERGHVTVGLRHTPSSGSSATALRIDEEAAAAAAKRLRALGKRLSLDGGVTVRDLLQVPGVVSDARADAMDDRVSAGATAAVDGALEALAESRAREGAHLAKECGEILDRIERAAAAIAERAPDVPKAYRDRLSARLATLLEGSGATLDPAHLAREVASFADRTDVTEEVARLRAHVAHARTILGDGGSAGRRLDFLVQEMNREANTAGSKSPDAALSTIVIDLKADVERLREQVQNLE
jgi:uncharacterized protein (TIGR00255 family)